jgi:uncharacterized membrane protein affecting hemolysin expression
MMKIIARVFWSLLFVAVLLGGYAFVRGKQSIRHEAVTAVKKGDVTQTVFAMADVVSAGSVDLSFKIDILPREHVVKLRMSLDGKNFGIRQYKIRRHDDFIG